jgi:cation transport regulator ChaC
MKWVLFFVQECTWGVAYLVNPMDVAEVMAYLNHREKGGYVTKEVLFYPKETDGDMKPFTTLMYIATETNPLYLGPAPVEDMARQIVKSRGPSGCNAEYALKLAHGMREIAPSVPDDHLFSLEKAINDIVKRCGVSGVRTKDKHCTCGICDLIDKSAV